MRDNFRNDVGDVVAGAQLLVSFASQSGAHAIFGLDLQLLRRDPFEHQRGRANVVVSIPVERRSLIGRIRVLV